MINFVLKEFNNIYLWAPDCYDESSLPRNAGCGPQKALFGLFNILVPDKILGMSIKLPCKIHDFSYGISKSEKELVQSDGYFLFNMQRTNDSYSKNRFMRFWRSNIFGIYMYYNFVSYYNLSKSYYLKNDLEK